LGAERLGQGNLTNLTSLDLWDNQIDEEVLKSLKEKYPL